MTNIQKKPPSRGCCWVTKWGMFLSTKLLSCWKGGATCSWAPITHCSLLSSFSKGLEPPRWMQHSMDSITIYSYGCWVIYVDDSLTDTQHYFNHSGAILKYTCCSRNMPALIASGKRWMSTLKRNQPLHLVRSISLDLGLGTPQKCWSETLWHLCQFSKNTAKLPHAFSLHMWYSTHFTKGESVSPLKKSD